MKECRCSTGWDIHRKGTIQPAQLFTEVDVTDETIALQGSIAKRILEIKSVISKCDYPNVDIGSYCNKPAKCPYYEQCHASIPMGSVYELPHGKSKIPPLKEMGIELLKQIPSSFPLTKRQAAIVKSAREKKVIVKYIKTRVQVMGRKANPLPYFYFFNFILILWLCSLKYPIINQWFCRHLYKLTFELSLSKAIYIFIHMPFKNQKSYQQQAFFIKMLIATEKINLIFLRACTW